MAEERVLTETVRGWAEARCRGASAPAPRAAALAAAAFASGATVPEACEAARAYVECWVRHPANAGRVGTGPLDGASPCPPAPWAA